MSYKKIGHKIYNDIKKLYPLNRSLTGNGTRKTLSYLKKNNKNFKILEFKSGTKIFDWKIPPEWNVRDAWIKYNNKKIIDFKNLNLHLVSYSEPMKTKITYQKLIKNLHFIKNIPNAIPYVTSYYKKTWGFCLSYNQYKSLKKKGLYEVNINSNFNENGSMSIGEILIKGKVKNEILLSTNICHPSMVSNELAGPVILNHIAKYYLNTNPYFSLRILFLPETIGSLTYLKYNLKKIKKSLRAGFHITCFGDKKKFSVIHTKYKNSYSDEILKKNFNNPKDFISYDFKFCGSDERQYNYPGINLPIATLTRSKFGEYKEYHNSLDNLQITNSKTLEESYFFIRKLIDQIIDERNKKIKNSSKIIKPDYLKKFIRKKSPNDLMVVSKTKGEPFLSKRNLYRTLSKNNQIWKYPDSQFIMFNTLYYGDGLRISQISKIISKPFSKIFRTAKILEKNGLVQLK